MLHYSHFRSELCQVDSRGPVLSIILPIPSLGTIFQNIECEARRTGGEEERPEDWRRQCQGVNYPLVGDSDWGRAGPIKVCKLAPQQGLAEEMRQAGRLTSHLLPCSRVDRGGKAAPSLPS